MTAPAYRLPLTDVTLTEEDVEAVLDCLRSGWLTMGPRIQEFERRFAEYVGAPHAVAVSSGTAALHLALLGAGVGPGDEVLVPAWTFVATAAAVRYCGAEPVLCDVRSAADPVLDPADVEARLTPRSKAVIAVHPMGHPAPMGELRALCDAHGLVLVEDAAQAVGARTDTGVCAGAASDAGCFSFFSKKQLCVGEGGMVCTADEALAAKVRSLRSHAMTSVTWDRHRGHAETYDIVDLGFNFRMDEPRAALGLSRLPRLAGDLDERRALVRAYRDRLEEVAGADVLWPAPDAVERSSHFCFAVLLADRATRDTVRVGLVTEGVQTTWYPSITEFTAYREHGSRPRSEEVAGRHVALPLSSSMTEADVDMAVAALRRVLA